MRRGDGVGETRTWFGRARATAWKGWLGHASAGQSKLSKANLIPPTVYLDPLSPLAPPLSSSAFLASAVSGTRNIGFEEAPNFMASRTMTL